MTLATLDNAIQMVYNDAAFMSSPMNMKAVNDLAALAQAARSLSSAAMSSNMGDTLSMMLNEKVREIENILASFGPQRLQAMGARPGGAPAMSPFTGAPMVGQNFQYPTMGQQGGFQPQFPPQGQPPNQMTQQVPQPQPQQPMAPPMPQAAPPPPDVAPIPPAAPAPQPEPAPMAPPPPATQAAAPSGPSVFMGLPGAAGGSSPDGAPATGRDYLLKVLSGG